MFFIIYKRFYGYLYKSSTELTQIAKFGISEANVDVPNANIITRSGGRLVLGDLANASSYVAVGKITTIHDPPYATSIFVDDGIHRFSLPGDGKVTALKGIGIAGDESVRNDLFLAQQTSCYILQNSDPNNPIQQVSTSVGVVNPDAIVQWGYRLFFVSLRGLEVLEPGSQPTLISQAVQYLFEGGGVRNIKRLDIDTCKLFVHDNRLLLSYTQDKTNNHLEKVLVLDLEEYQRGQYHGAYNKGPKIRYSEWGGSTTKGSFNYFAVDESNKLIVADNNPVSSKIVIGESDSTALQEYHGISPICIRTGGIMSELVGKRKTLANVITHYDSFSEMSLEVSVNLEDTVEANLTIANTGVGKIYYVDVATNTNTEINVYHVPTELTTKVEGGLTVKKAPADYEEYFTDQDGVSRLDVNGDNYSEFTLRSILSKRSWQSFTPLKKIAGEFFIFKYTLDTLCNRFIFMNIDIGYRMINIHRRGVRK